MSTQRWLPKLLLASLSLAACTGAPAAPPPAPEKPLPKLDVSAGDTRVRATGRVDTRDRARTRFSYPGVSFELAFEGSGVSALLDDRGSDDEKQANHYQVVLDGKPQRDFPVARGPGDYELASGLDAGRHHVTLYRLTESHVGESELLGFRVHGDRARALDPAPRPERRLEIIGDSITCGYGNELSVEPPPRGNPSTGFTAENENHYLSYGAIAARELEAELHSVCVSGIGVTRDYGGKTEAQMPDLFTRTLPAHAEPGWDFSRYVPDAVIVNLGTNDFGQGLPDPVTFIAAYEGFVAALRELYPRAHIACLTGTMVSDAWPAGEARLSKLNAWVSGVVERRREGGDDRISFLAMTPQSPPFGEDWHPTLATHRRMARELRTHLERTLGW